MQTAGFWLIGFGVLSTLYAALSAPLRRAFDLAPEGGRLDRYAAFLEDRLDAIGAALFLSLPVAAVVACYKLGEGLWHAIT
jgi:hypothetical protein